MTVRAPDFSFIGKAGAQLGQAIQSIPGAVATDQKAADLQKARELAETNLDAAQAGYQALVAEAEKSGAKISIAPPTAGDLKGYMDKLMAESNRIDGEIETIGKREQVLGAAAGQPEQPRPEGVAGPEMESGGFSPAVPKAGHLGQVRERLGPEISGADIKEAGLGLPTQSQFQTQERLGQQQQLQQQKQQQAEIQKQEKIKRDADYKEFSQAMQQERVGLAVKKVDLNAIKGHKLNTAKEIDRLKKELETLQFAEGGSSEFLKTQLKADIEIEKKKQKVFDKAFTEKLNEDTQKSRAPVQSSEGVDRQLREQRLFDETGMRDPEGVLFPKEETGAPMSALGGGTLPVTGGLESSFPDLAARAKELFAGIGISNPTPEQLNEAINDLRRQR